MTPRRPVGGDSTLISRDEWLEGVTWYVALETPSSPEPSNSIRVSEQARMTDLQPNTVCPLVLMRHKDNFLPTEDGKGSAGGPPQEPGDGDRKCIFPGEPFGT